MGGVGFRIDGDNAVEACSDEAGFAYVICPSPAFAWRFELRQCTARALLRATDGTLWLLSTTGLAFTCAHLAAANARICQPTATDPAGIADELAARFGVSALLIAAPRTLDAQELWSIPQIAGLLVDGEEAQSARASSRAIDTQRSLAVGRQLRSRLEAAVAALVASLETESVALASQRQFDARIYNWLLRGQRGRRRQFARAFAPLLPYAAAGHRRAAALDRIVDRGEKLADGLAALWSVRPGVIRALQQSPQAIAPMWLRDPKSLAALLDALPPETWPRDPAAWLRFDRLVNRAVRTLTPTPWASTVALAWLRDALTGPQHGGDAQPAGDRLRTAVARVQQMRDVLVELLAASLRRYRSPKAAAIQRAAAVVDGFLLKLSTAQQRTLADRYRDELLRSVGSDVLAEQIGLLHGARGWPLLPGDYVSPDGRRRAVSVCSRQELRRCGEVFENCLRSSHFDGYARRLVEGSAFYVALLDARTAEPCSLAEIAVKKHAAELVPLTVAQHQTVGNSGLPSVDCRAAMSDLMRLAKTAPVQAHLRKGLLAMDGRGALARAGSGIVGRNVLTAALWRVIGAQGMTAMVQRVTAVARGQSTAPAGAGLPAAQMALAL